MTRKQESIPVIFRAEAHGDFKGEVTAVLPSLMAGPGRILTYAHIGQHSEGSLAWYHVTRPATREEYEPLLKELRGIYDNEHGALSVRKRLR